MRFLLYKIFDIKKRGGKGEKLNTFSDSKSVVGITGQEVIDLVSDEESTTTSETTEIEGKPSTNNCFSTEPKQRSRYVIFPEGYRTEDGNRFETERDKKYFYEERSKITAYLNELLHNIETKKKNILKEFEALIASMNPILIPEEQRLAVNKFYNLKDMLANKTVELSEMYRKLWDENIYDGLFLKSAKKSDLVELEIVLKDSIAESAIDKIVSYSELSIHIRNITGSNSTEELRKSVRDMFECEDWLCTTYFHLMPINFKLPESLLSNIYSNVGSTLDINVPIVDCIKKLQSIYNFGKNEWINNVLKNLAIYLSQVNHCIVVMRPILDFAKNYGSRGN